jgi:two-component system sensor histidine kinase ChvG
VKKFLVRARAALRGIMNFSSLSRTIFMSNMIAVLFLMLGILYLNQLRAGLVAAKVESLQTQGEIIAGAIAASATADTDQIIVDPESLLETGPDAPFIGNDAFTSLEFPIDPERVAPILRRLVQPTGTRARIYDQDSTLIIDSQRLYSGGSVSRYDLPPVVPKEENLYSRIEQWFKRILFYRDLPKYQEDLVGDGSVYDEVGAAISGTTTPMVRVTNESKQVVSVAVPIRRLRRVLGVLLLSTKGSDIEQTVRAERSAIIRLTMLAFCISLLTSLFLTRYIAQPMRRLSAAAKRVGESIKAREEIPDFTNRKDEIGQLSGSFRDMTAALYRRLDAIETFAADVSHELKNPLTSLRSAAETLGLVKNDEQKARLVEIIQNDVKRLDRLISDISDASRLDAELAREDTGIVDVEQLLHGSVNVFNDIHRGHQPDVNLRIDRATKDNREFLIRGHDSRLGQVINNLLDNSISFSPKNGKVWITAMRRKTNILIIVEDEGPGIPEEHLSKIFKRFYTDRPEGEEFGNNSGLGLSISQQIVVAHKGRIWAENRYGKPGEVEQKQVQPGQKPHGARFIIELPASFKLTR